MFTAGSRLVQDTAGSEEEEGIEGGLMTAETDIAAIDDGGENTAAEVRTALTSILARADLDDSWGPWEPVWTARSVNPTIGNGSLVGRFVQIGGLVIGNLTLTLGSTTTTGTGVWEFSLPVAPATTDDWSVLGSGVFVNTGVGTNVGVGAWRTLFDSVDMVNDGGQIAPTHPFTWGDTDVLSFRFAYEAE